MQDTCWACGVDVRRNPNTKANDHHIIPRAYGGEDGPQVTLCSAHHSMLHDIEVAWYAKRDAQARALIESMTGQSEQLLLRVLWLASRVYLAHVTFESDHNRRVPVSVRLAKEDLALLNQLTKTLGLSREKVLRQALRTLHQQNFPLPEHEEEKP